MNVHDPYIRKGGTFSPKRIIALEYQNDCIYEAGNPDYFAVYRGGSDALTNRRDTYLTSRYFIKLANIFCMEGGLSLLREKLNRPNEVIPSDFVGGFMSIIDAICPYLLNRTIDQFGDDIIRSAIFYMLESPPDVVKTFTSEMIQNVYSGVQHLSKRAYPRKEAVETYERFLLKIAILCLKTDYLERKLNGVSFLGEIHKLIKAKDFICVGKADLLEVIEHENIVEQILKGHPQLIAKSQELLKLIFDEKAMTEKNMQLLWTTMRKGDLETRNSILSILNSIYYELSFKNMEFLIHQIGEVEPKLLMPDEIELAFKMVNFSKYKSDYPSDRTDEEPLPDKVVRMFWRISSSPDISNADLISKSINKMMSLMKTVANPALEKAIIQEGIDNLKKGQAVIQSMEVLKEILALPEIPNEELVEYLVSQGAVQLALGTLKKLKADIRLAGTKASTNVSENTVNSLLGDKNYTFEVHVQKRLAFVSALLGGMRTKEAVVAAIETIWEELVENSIIEAEVGYFKNWFVSLASKESKGLITKDILVEFFTAKVKVLLQPRTSGSKSEVLSIFTLAFINMNILARNINVLTVRIEEEQGYSSEIRHVLTKSPSQLEGIEALWEIILNCKDPDIPIELMNFITNLYTRPELDVMDPEDGYSSYLKEFIDICVSKLQTIGTTSADATMASWRLLCMLRDIIDKSESKYLTPSRSLSSFYRGKTATVTVENKISNYYSTAKNIEVKVTGNTTIQQIKLAVTKDLRRTTWRQVKLSKGYKKIEIPDRYNCRNLRELGISLNDKFISEYRPTPVIKPEPLIMGGEGEIPYINPKAVRAFKTVFNVYQVDSKMGPNELVKMCEVVLDERNLSTEFPQVKETLAKYDKEKKGYLTEEDFVTFYKDATFSKSGAVYQNLRNLNFNDQLVLNTNTENFEPTPEFLARDYLLKEKESFVFWLLDITEKVPSLREQAWNILSRLPPLPATIKQIVNLEGVKGLAQPSWDMVIDSQSTYKALYNLFILDFLLEDAKSEEGESLFQGLISVPVEEFKKEWKTEFIRCGGYQHLFEVLKKFVAKGVKTEHEVLLFSFIMRTVKTYLLACVTIKHPEVYANVAFIPTTKIPFTALILKSGAVSAATKISIEDHKSESLPTCPIPTAESGTQKAIGPQTEIDTAKKSAPVTTTNTIQKEEDKQQELLVEKIEFIQFREALMAMGETGEARVDKVETLRFLISLCEDILTKSEQQHFEELSIVELSLAIIFCLILSDQALLHDMVVTDKVRVLREESVSKAEGYSDFVSFFLAGLLTKRGYLYVKLFDNAFKILLREGGTKDVQNILVKVVFENAVKTGLSLRDSARHIELAVLLLGSICSDQKDPKILLGKSDINSIVNLQVMFFDIFSKIFTTKAASKDELYFENELLSGYFKLLEKILAIEPKLKHQIAKSHPQIVERLFSECLFNSPEGQSERRELICKNYFTRTAAFELLSEVCRGESDSLKTLLNCGLNSLSRNLPKVSSWSYTASQGKRSELGYVGIYNLSSICYMNAMLQQFYLTPTFRYGLLLADDYQSENMVTIEDKRIEVDDNLFHQLQKLFAFLDRSERRDYNPSEFCFSYKDYSGLPVNVGIQQDTKEFLDVFFDKIERALKPTPLRNILFDVYGGKTINLIECSSCSNLRTSEDIFYNLSLEVKNLKNISEGIEKFITEDTISDYKCEKCMQKCDVFKRTLIKDCPNVLIVHLQRIIFDLDVLMNVKINTFYEFPQKLNLQNYTYDHYMKHHKKRNEKKGAEEFDDNSADQSTNLQPEPSSDTASQPPEEKKTSEDNFEYNLAGVIVHLGSADVGHYYSYINVNRNDPGRPKM